MRDLIKYLITEEWRTHTTLFGSFLFVLFPIIVILMVLAMAVFIPIINLMMAESTAMLILHLIIAFLGLQVGAFGIYGQEFMQRRFGHASLLSYSARILPLSDRKIFLAVVIKDILYYFCMLLMPIIIGLSLITILIPDVHIYLRAFVPSCILAFLMGIAVVFFLSIVFAHSRILLLVAAAGIGFLFAMIGDFPPFMFYMERSLTNLLLATIPSFILIAMSIWFFKVDERHEQHRFKNQLKGRKDLLFTKDMIDLHRSRGGIGRIIFSLLLPMAFIWFFLKHFVEYLSIVNFLFLFSVFLGVYSSSIYNWICRYDTYGQYSYLPIRIFSVILTKVRISLALGTIPIIIFIAAAINEQSSPLVVLLSATSAAALYVYGLAITVLLTGLAPHILFFNGKVLVKYLILIIPPPVILIVLSVFAPQYLFLATILFVLSWYIVRWGAQHWENSEQQLF
ncbi:hypothetical protein H6504_01175 [Candidatus Woesearchaeota archaeon]|nr:hypothetical protein [Candidatus Woesearchaeota archaeon]